MDPIRNDWLYSSPAFQAFFENSPRSLVLKADPPLFTILAVSNDYLAITHRERQDILDKPLFEVYPGSQADPSEKNSVYSSFMRAIHTKKTDVLPTFKYEIFVAETGKLETEYWSNVNEPLLDDNGHVVYIINTTANITEQVMGKEAVKEAILNKEALKREQALNEELAATNEELVATNDELHVTQEKLNALNAELEKRVQKRTKALLESEEKLQRLNDELTATNEELTASNEEQSAVNEELLVIQQELLRQTGAKQKAIDRLEANERNIRNMVRQAPVGMCIVQGEPLYVVEANSIFLEIIGKRREEFYNTPYWDVNAEAKAYYEPITDNVLKTGATYFANEHEILLIRKGIPEIVYVDFVYEPMKDEVGKPHAIIIVAIDVTEKVLSRRKIEQAEESLRLATESAGLGTWSLPINSDEYSASTRSKEIFGLLPHETLSQQLKMSRIFPDYRGYVVERVQACFSKGIPLFVEYPITSQQNGEKERWVRAVGKVIDNQKGKEKYITGILADITEQKQDEQRKNDFIGMVSHEMKTPLTSMSGYLQMLQLKANAEGNSYILNMAEKANRQVSRMTTLINGFLNVSRLESGKIQIDKQRFDMALLVKEVEEETESMYNTHRIVFAPVEETFVFADWDKIGQVISNLISNAVKYSPANTSIKVECVTVKGCASVSVKDEGIGIKEEDQTRLFERYYRVNNDNSTTASGFGIGLYLCREIIERHEGKIWVESEVGKGSTFSFNLPVIE